ncbi:secreted acidic protein 1A-like [Penaeus monodon]|uniref:secreted acidic protein 1A-like n=1 Tax=Penaeus monodon TaxID=6687 RepID=UPI0018A7A542|nr:secreted acidic protein 1A-like [Penaeus monodon]
MWIVVTVRLIHCYGMVKWSLVMVKSIYGGGDVESLCLFQLATVLFHIGTAYPPWHRLEALARRGCPKERADCEREEEDNGNDGGVRDNVGEDNDNMIDESFNGEEGVNVNDDSDDGEDNGDEHEEQKNDNDGDKDSDTGDGNEGEDNDGESKAVGNDCDDDDEIQPTLGRIGAFSCTCNIRVKGLRARRA